MDDREKKLRIKELEQLITQKRADRDFYKAMQLSLKLVLNGTYGAFANKYFVCSNADIANAITAHGRDVNQFMMEKIEDHFYNKWHLNTELHKKLSKEYICEVDGNYQAYTVNFEPIGWSENTLKDLLRHKGLEESELVPNEFNKGNIKVLYDYNIWNFSNIEPLDHNPEWIEEEGRPKYNGDNQIVVYGDTDSLYVSFTPIMKSVGFDKIEDIDWGRRFILHVDAIYVKPVFNQFLKDYAKQFGIKSLHDFELETISKSALFLKKKHYLNNVVWEDGVFYSDLSYFYPKGIEIVRSSTPPFVRKNIYRVINYLFDNAGRVDIYQVLKIVKEIRKEFELADIEDISMTTSCSNYDDKILDDTESIDFMKGTHFGVKAAAFHNFLLNKNSEFKTKYDMVKSGRIKYYYCKHQMANVFGYLRSFHPHEIVEKEKVMIDMDEQFEKCFLGIVNKFIKPLGLPEINKRLSVLNSLFNF
jgi:DNA polymerase elongation subunit (family B)